MRIQEKSEDPDSFQGISNMGFLEHLEELRITLVKCSVIFIVACILIAFNLQDLTSILLQPLAEAMDSTEKAREVLRTSRPMGIFSVILQVVFFGALGLSLPFMMYFVAGFISPALSQKEKKTILPSCILATLLFLSGIALSYYFILPISLEFSVNLNERQGLIPLWSASAYYGLVVWLSLAVGISFQFPLLIILFAYLELIPISKLQSSRKIVFIIMMVFAALITPGGDPITLVLLTGVLYALYEIALTISKFLVGRKNT
jgi:sec-independent protein translocase protein TatC